MKNNFLFVLPTAFLGGAERVMFNLMLHLLAQGNKVTVYIMSRGDQIGWEEIKKHSNTNFIIKNYPSEKTSVMPFTKEIYALSRKENFNYAFSSHTHINALLSIYKKVGILKVESIISRESTFIFERFFGIKRLIFKVMYMFFYGKQSLLISQTTKMQESLVSNLGYKPVKNMQVISNPVNLEDIDKKKIEKIEKIFDPMIVSCGRLIDLKKVDDLISAFSGVSDNQAGLVIIGEGPNEEKLKKIANEMGLNKRIIFLGKIKNPIAWFARADIGVISSEIEGFPNVLIEMMAAGTKKIITTPCSDGVKIIPDIVVTKKIGSEAIRNELEIALSHPSDDSKKYRTYIEKERSIESYWNTIQESIK